MAECRACLIKNVRMHIITDTRYREMFEKMTGNNLSIEDGRPETICYICKAQLQSFWRFFEMTQKTEKMLTARLKFGMETQDAHTSMYRLSSSVVKAVSFVDDGAEPAPEVTVTVKAELDEADEWEQFKEEFMDSDEYENDDYDRIELPQTEETEMTGQDKEITETNSSENELQTQGTEMTDQDKEITETTNFKNAEEKDIKNEQLGFIKTKSIKTEETLNSQNLSTEKFPIQLEKFPIQTEEMINLNKIKIKEEKFPLMANIQKPKFAYLYCNECQYRCRQTKTLRKHGNYHDPKNRFACNFCLYRFPEETKLIRHKKYCTVCKTCGKKFHNLNGLQIHMRLHTGELPFSCDLCGRGFNQKTNLRTHLRVHDREKQYPCKICHKIFPFTTYLKRHMLIHSKNHIDNESMHRIQNCHKLFSRKKRVMSECTVCRKILRKDSMAMHMRLHTGELPFSCEKCLRFFNQKCNLLTHVERCHAGDPLFACKICFKTFPMNSELRKHLVTHGVNIEIKKELIDQTEQSIKKFISRCEKEVEQRIEALTEADKKMELIFNLGLKPREVNPQEPNGMNVIQNFNEEVHIVNAKKRKGNFLQPGVKNPKRKTTGVSLLRQPVGMINRIKIEGFSSSNTKVDTGKISAGKQIMKRVNILRRDSVVQHVQGNFKNLTCLYIIPELKISDPKVQEPPTDSTRNIDQSNSLTTEDIPKSNCIFVATTRNINKGSNVGTPNIKEVEIKREFISENNILTENEVVIESLDNITASEDKNLSNEATNKNLTEEVSAKNEGGNFAFCNEITGNDIEYFDDGTEMVEVEISESEDYTNITENNAQNEEITLTNEDLKVTEINLNQNSLAGTEKEKTTNEEVLATEELEISPQALLLGEDVVMNEDDRRQSISYTGVEISVIDPNDVDDSDEDSEEENIQEEYLDLSDELNKLDGDNFEEEEVPSDDVIDLSYADDKREINNTPQQKSDYHPRIKLRSDLFVNDDKIKLNSNVEINLETNNRISTVNPDMSNKEVSIDVISNDDVEDIATKENDLDDFGEVEYLDIDSNYDHLETISTNEDNVDTTDAEDLSSDSKDAILILEKDFDVFQQKHQIIVHRSLNKLATPYACELCVT